MCIFLNCCENKIIVIQFPNSHYRHYEPVENNHSYFISSEDEHTSTGNFYDVEVERVDNNADFCITGQRIVDIGFFLSALKSLKHEGTYINHIEKLWTM